jgi:DNA-binding NarL/FixJ family response regulator
MTTVHSIFLVDDHPLVREWLRALLTQQGDFNVCGEAESAPEALQKITQLKPDVVIVDISLSSGSGLELVRDIRRVSPQSIPLMLTMHDELTYAERALRAGARGYVSKRNTTRNIITALRHVLRGKVYVSDEFKELMTEKLLLGGEQVVTPVRLSDRELEVMRMLGEGRDTREIGDSLSISVKTVQVYYARIREKLHLSSHTDLLREAIRRHDAGTGPQGTA